MNSATFSDTWVRSLKHRRFFAVLAIISLLCVGGMAAKLSYSHFFLRTFREPPFFFSDVSWFWSPDPLWVPFSLVKTEKIAFFSSKNMWESLPLSFELLHVESNAEKNGTEMESQEIWHAALAEREKNSPQDSLTSSPTALHLWFWVFPRKSFFNRNFSSPPLLARWSPNTSHLCPSHEALKRFLYPSFLLDRPSEVEDGKGAAAEQRKQLHEVLALCEDKALQTLSLYVLHITILQPTLEYQHNMFRIHREEAPMIVFNITHVESILYSQASGNARAGSFRENLLNGLFVLHDRTDKMKVRGKKLIGNRVIGIFVNQKSDSKPLPEGRKSVAFDPSSLPFSLSVSEQRIDTPWLPGGPLLYPTISQPLLRPTYVCYHSRFRIGVTIWEVMPSNDSLLHLFSVQPSTGLTTLLMEVSASSLQTKHASERWEANKSERHFPDSSHRRFQRTFTDCKIHENERTDVYRLKVEVFASFNLTRSMKPNPVNPPLEIWEATVLLGESGVVRVEKTFSLREYAVGTSTKKSAWYPIRVLEACTGTRVWQGKAANKEASCLSHPTQHSFSVPLPHLYLTISSPKKCSMTTRCSTLSLQWWREQSIFSSISRISCRIFHCTALEGLIILVISTFSCAVFSFFSPFILQIELL